MEAILREEVREFTRACGRFAGFVHLHNGLTNAECKTIHSFVRALEQDIASHPHEDGIIRIPPSHVTILDGHASTPETEARG